jgi:hypothetical protein
MNIDQAFQLDLNNLESSLRDFWDAAYESGFAAGEENSVDRAKEERDAAYTEGYDDGYDQGVADTEVE